MTVIGTAVLQIIPSLDGVEGAIDKQLGGKLRASGKVGGKQFAKGVGDGLKDLDREVASAGKAYQKLKDKASDALGKIRVEEERVTKARSGGKSDQIAIAEERLAKARRDSARASREAGDSHTLLLGAQKRLGDGTNDLGGKFGKLSGLAGSAGTALAGIGVAAGGAALAGVAALAAGAVVAGNRLYELGQQFDDTFDNIRIKTGATGPALEALEAATKKLSTSVPLSIGEIGNVVAETSRALHLTGPELDNVAGSIANLGRITGENVDIRTLGKAFRGFGVDAKAQVPALDALFRASQATGIGVNELVATVVKGGAGLRQFGFDFGESAALATQFEQAGLSADKAMSGLTKGLAALAKNGQTGEQALRDNVTQIKGLIAAGNDAAALDLTNKLFGARGGVQFFEAIKNGALDLDALSASLSNTGDSIAAAAADTDDWSERWQTFKNTFAVALEPLATTVFDSVNEQLGNLATWIEGHQDQVVDFFVSIGQGAITGVDIALDALGQLAEGVGQFLQPFGDVQGAMLDFQAFQATIRGDHDTARQLKDQAQEAYGWGEGLDAAGAAMRNFDPSALRGKLDTIGDSAKTSADKVDGIGAALGALPAGKTVTVDADTGPAEAKMQDWFAKWKAIIAAPPTPTPAAPPVPSLTNPTRYPIRPGRATGGAVFGAGTATSDSIPAMLSNDEHVFTAADVKAMGGQGAVYGFRSMLHRSGGGSVWPQGAIIWPPEPPGPKDKVPGGVPNRKPGRHKGTIGLPHWDPGVIWGPPPDDWWLRPVNPDDILFPDLLPPGSPWRDPHGKWRHPHDKRRIRGFAGGGAVGPDVTIAGGYVGTAYSQANRTDCSGMVARIINDTLGMGGGLMSTKNAAQWLKERGFVPGVGGPGQISVGWYDHGPNPNDGHMAMTLSDGSSAEAGGGVGDIFQIGGGAASASSPQFDQHMYLPTVYGEGPAGPAAVSSPFADGSAAAAMAGVAPTVSTASSGGGGGGFSIPSSLAGFGSFAGGKLGDLTKLGEAAGSFIDGQIGSVLDVFGVPATPGWLQGISQFVSGISVSRSGGGGGSADPLAAFPNATGTPPPGDAANMHGTRAGQQPGVTYNITARDTEDAFIRAQRKERERAAAKLSRF